jgi:hypothetical protein
MQIHSPGVQSSLSVNSFSKDPNRCKGSQLQCDNAWCTAPICRYVQGESHMEAGYTDSGPFGTDAEVPVKRNFR